MNDTIKFLDLLDDSEKPFIFGCYDYRKEKKPIQLYGTLAECFPRLKELNDEGFDIYVCVNETKGRTRKLDDIIKVRAVWCEDDNPTADSKPRTDWPIPPSMVVESSPGKFHYYWFTETGNKEQFDRVMLSMVANYGCDKKARDICRVLRLPGFVHKKDLTRPFTCRLVSHNKIRHMWPAVIAAFGMSDQEFVKADKEVNAEFTYDNALKDLLSGANYHNNLVSISMSLTNRGVDRDTQLHILTGLMLQAKKREGWEDRIKPEHLYEMIDQGIRKLQQEKSGTIQTVFESTNNSSIPDFPNGVLKRLPEPWPMIFDVYASHCYDVNEALLVPTILSSMAFFLDGRYITENNRKPQCVYLNLAATTVGKDVNSVEVLQSLSKAFQHAGSGIPIDPYAPLLTFPSAISAASSFIQAYHDTDLYMLSTEATTLYQQIGNATKNNGNSSVAALGSKIIEAANGITMSGYQKANEGVEGFDDNTHIVFYAQKRTIAKHIDESMIDSGFFGRFQITVVKGAGKTIDDEGYNPFDQQNPTRATSVPQDFIELVMKLHNSKKSARKNSSEGAKSDRVAGAQSKACLSKEQIAILGQWIRNRDWSDHIRRNPEDPEGDLSPAGAVLIRTAQYIEQLYALIYGVCREWDEIKGKEIREDVDITALLELVDYWSKCKVYAIQNLINKSQDPLEEAVIDVIKDLVTGKLRTGNSKAERTYKKAINDYSAAALPHIVAKLRQRTTVLDKLNLSAQGLTEKVSKTVDALVKSGMLVEVNVTPRVKAYGIADMSKLD